MNKIILLLTFSIIVSCNDSNKGVYTTASNSQIDSILNSIQKISDTTELIKQLKLIKKITNKDTLLCACINEKLLKIDTSATKYHYLLEIEKMENVLCKSVKGKEIIALGLYNLNYYSYKKGKFLEVVNNSEKYLKYTNIRLDSMFKSSLLSTMGEAYMRLGDEKKALITLCKSLESARTTSEKVLATAGLCNIYSSNGNEKKARTLINQALQIKNIDSINKELLKLYSIVYESNTIKRKNNAIILSKTTKSNYVHFYIYTILTELYIDENDYEKAIIYAKKAIATPEQETRMIAKKYLLIGELKEEQNQKDSATYYYNQGLQLLCKLENKYNDAPPILDSVFAENTIFDLCVSQANIFINKSELNTTNCHKAIKHLLCAKKVADLLRKQLVFDESKYEWGIDLKDVSEKLLYCYYQLFIKTKNILYAQKAYMILEENKANTMQDNVESSILANQASDTNYAKYISLRKQLNDVQVQQASTTSIAQKQILQKEYEDLVMQLGMYKSISKLSLNGKDISYNYSQQLAYLIKTKSNIYSYFVGKEKVYLLSLDAIKNEIKFELADTSITDSVQVLCNMQSQENIYSTQKHRFIQLSNYIYQSIFKSIEIKNLNTNIILPDAVLNNLAFDALLTDSTKINSFLLRRCNLSYAYSIRSLMNQQMRVYNGNKAILSFAPFSNHAIRNLPKLNGSSTEIKLITQTHQSKIYENQKATFSNFMHQLSNHQYIHIASHASAGETPLLEFYDSSIHVTSIYNIPMNQSLAYLNTCQSGSGINYYSEGNLSLGRAFYSNGVHNIVLTLWNMNDASTATISNAFYKNLRQSNNSITALHEAKLDYLATQPLDKQAPYYWASLQHVGDGLLQTNTNWHPYLVFGLGSIIFIIIVLYSLSKRKIALQSDKDVV